MPTAWYIIPYRRRPARRRPTRYVAIDDHTAQIRDYGGTWSEVEVLGDRAIVKVRAPAGDKSLDDDDVLNVTVTLTASAS